MKLMLSPFSAVMYLQTNPGGITIFGWTVDRALLNTIFFIELSLVTWVLGKTIVLTSSKWQFSIKLWLLHRSFSSWHTHQENNVIAVFRHYSFSLSDDTFTWPTTYRKSIIKSPSSNFCRSLFPFIRRSYCNVHASMVLYCNMVPRIGSYYKL